MKTIVVICLLLASNAIASENPDKFPSIELLFHQEFNEVSSSVGQVSMLEASSKPFAVSTKFLFPVNDNTTIIAGGGYSYSSDKYSSSSGGLIIGESKQSGFFLNAGVKFYLAPKEKTSLESRDIPEIISPEGEQTEKISYVTITNLDNFEIISSRLEGLSSIYSVAIIDTNWAEIRAFGGSHLYNKGNSLIVLYFNDKYNTPDISKTGIHFEKRYKPYCVAVYYKYPDGSDRLIKYPGK